MPSEPVVHAFTAGSILACLRVRLLCGVRAKPVVRAWTTRLYICTPSRKRIFPKNSNQVPFYAGLRSIATCYFRTIYVHSSLHFWFPIVIYSRESFIVRRVFIPMYTHLRYWNWWCCMLHFHQIHLLFFFQRNRIKLYNYLCIPRYLKKKNQIHRSKMTSAHYLSTKRVCLESTIELCLFGLQLSSIQTKVNINTTGVHVQCETLLI